MTIFGWFFALGACRKATFRRAWLTSNNQMGWMAPAPGLNGPVWLLS